MFFNFIHVPTVRVNSPEASLQTIKQRSTSISLRKDLSGDGGFQLIHEIKTLSKIERVELLQSSIEVTPE